MAPQSKKRQSPRHKPVFNIKEIVLYGIPLWIGLPLIGWYFEGWLGLNSSLFGLVVLSAYIASEVFVDKRSRNIPGSKAVKLIVVSFGARFIVLLLITILLYLYTTISLMFFLITVAFGFTAMLFISIKNWL